MLVKFDYLYFTYTGGQEGNMAMWAREKLEYTGCEAQFSKRNHFFQRWHRYNRLGERQCWVTSTEASRPRDL